MSHPWKAQPYYHYRGGPLAPQPLGGVHPAMPARTVQEALAGYTRGSFAPKSPWATPAYYILDEPTGVDGFGAFGQDAAGCVPYETVKGKVAAALKSFLDAKLSGGVRMAAMMFESTAASKAAQLVKQASDQGTNIEQNLENLAYKMINVALGAIGGEARDFVPPEALKQFVSFLRKEGFDFPSVCAPSAAAVAVPDSVKQACGGNPACIDIYKRAQAGQITIGQAMREIEAWVATQAPAAPPVTMTTVQKVAMTPKQMVEVMLRPSVQAAIKAQQAAAAKPTGVSPVVLGAAALAALMLLR
jgi:hypothetical protein